MSREERKYTKSTKLGSFGERLSQKTRRELEFVLAKAQDRKRCQRRRH